MTKPGEFEHVTRYFYRNPHEFKIENIAAERRYEGLHLAIDTTEDLATFMAIVDAMERPHWDYGLDDIVAIHDSLFARDWT